MMENYFEIAAQGLDSPATMAVVLLLVIVILSFIDS